MRRYLRRKHIAFAIIFCVLGACLPSVLSQEKQPVTPVTTNSTIKVDDDGDGDYTTIAAALANATIGDTIEVYSGTYMEGNLLVNKQLYLKGINRELGSGNGVGKPVVNANNTGSVFRIEAVGIELSGFNITKTGSSGSDAGVRLAGAGDNCSIHDNNISYCFLGIAFYIGGAVNNVIFNNTFRANTAYHLNCHASSLNNIIYHNSFFGAPNKINDGSTTNHWNASYPTGGNYWSDYTGVDHLSGPGQNLSGSDGIGDTPKLVDSDTNAYDHYPLMWQPPDCRNPTVNITQPKERSIYLLGNYLMQRILNITKPLIIGPINITVNASDNRSGVAKVEFYIDGELKWTDTEAPYSYLWNESVGLLQNHTKMVKVIAYDRGANTASEEIVVAKFF
jgi:parallel beta-helix repeat protein